MTIPSHFGGPPAGPAGPRPRDPDLALARMHLRLGLLELARTELETLAGRGALDDDGIRDLAEARWRTGDTGGAGEAAASWLESHPEDILGLVIAAEAQAALGRPAEARRLAGRALERAQGSLDPVFAGMQRSSIWPAEAGAGIGPVGVLFDDLHPGPRAMNGFGPAGGPDLAGDAGPAAAVTEPLAPLDPGVPAAIAGGPSLWGEDAALGAPSGDVVDPALLLDRGRVALVAGRLDEAATGLLLALRGSPALAPAVLDLLAGRHEPLLVLIRGDAERIVGRELDASRDHAEAAAATVASPAAAIRPDPYGAPAPEADSVDRHPDQEDS